MDRDSLPATATQANSGGNKGRNIGRRAFVYGVGGAAAGAGALSMDSGPVQETEAVVPLIAAGAVAIGASVSLGWALREFEVVGSNPPAQGLTSDVLQAQNFKTAKTRKSTNASSIVDNSNILDGVENTAYTEGKIAAIEELNAGSSESAVLTAGRDASKAYFATVEKNLLKTWNESVRELNGMVSAVESHPDRTLGNGLTNIGGTHDYQGTPIYTERTHTLVDGSSFNLLMIDDPTTGGSSDDYEQYDPVEKGSDGSYDTIYKVKVVGANETLSYLDFSKWNPIHSQILTKSSNVASGLSTWVTNVYGQVQSGDIPVSDLLTPREQAATMTDDGKYPQAVADLTALNVPVDLEREATVSISSTGTTLKGTFALTDSSDGPLESGTTYDPSTFTGDAYLTTDISRLEGTWSAFQTGVNGGVITLTDEPYESMVYSVSTAAGETVDVPAADWTDNGDGTYSYDASGDLETAITDVSEISYSSASSETTYETIQLDSQFTIEKFENTETGEEASSTSFTSSEPQTDSNYITQDEWNSLEQQNKELIEKYEESQNSGFGGGGGGFLSDSGGLTDLGVLAAGGALVVYLLGN